MLESLFNKLLPYGLQLYLKETSTKMLSCEYCEISTKSFFYGKPPVASDDLLFLIENNVAWFLLKRFVDLVIVRYSHFSGNHSNTVLLIGRQKTNLPKVNHCRKVTCHIFPPWKFHWNSSSRSENIKIFCVNY